MVIFPIPGIYKKTKRKVSIIVPLFRSQDVLRDQIRHWTTDGIDAELIYVCNQCPGSTGAVLKWWGKHPSRNQFQVKLLLLDKNHGYGTACNEGANIASSDLLIFLNADTITTPGWLSNLIEPLERSNVGIVGNLQLKDGGPFDGTIDSAGSEWHWNKLNFEHIGRHSFEGKPIPTPFSYHDAPPAIMKQESREMVTGCCFGIRKKVFLEAGGFDPHYKLGYWEDSELCISVREMGYSCLFVPESVIYHKLGHSGMGNHPFQRANKAYFLSKWLKSGRLHKLVGGKQPKVKKVKKILVKREGAHGDVLMASGIPSVFRMRYPEAEIHFCTKCPSILEHHPDIDKIITKSNLKYDIVCDLDLAYERRPFTHVLQAYAYEAGMDFNEITPRISIHPYPIEISDYVVMHAGMTNWPGRNYGKEEFGEIVQKLKSDGIKTVLIGSQADLEIPDTLDLRGKTVIQETASIIKNSRMFIGIDSLPFQISQATNTPAVVFFGSINPDYRIYRNNVRPIMESLPCLGCHHQQPAPVISLATCHLGTRACEKVSPKAFYEAVAQSLKEYDVQRES